MKCLGIQAIVAQNSILLEWAFKHMPPGCINEDNLMDCGCMVTIPICQILDRNIKLSGYCKSVLAGQCGSIPVLEWMLDNRWSFMGPIMLKACKFGLEVVKWLCDHKAPWMWEYDEKYLIKAAKHGHLDLLQWCMNGKLRTKVLPRKALSQAVRYGHFEVAKWLRQQGVQWDSGAYNDISASVNVNMILWAIDDGFPVTEDLLAGLANSGIATLASELRSKHKYMK
jgi:hypothetical protein